MEMTEHMYRLCVGAGFSPVGTAEAFLEHGQQILEAENIQ
jgi:cation diffusion facilitator CzcD-associated flavoprotein CzcO